MAEKSRKRIPKRLKKEPLLEAVWELRFEGDPAAGGALPGILYEKLKAQGENATIETLQLGSIPRKMRETQEQLRYAPTTVLRYKNYAVFIGDRTTALSVVKPYPGWREYERVISTLVTWLRESGMITNVEQSTLKYLDFFEYRPDEVFKKLRVQVQLGGAKLQGGELQLQAKIARDGFEGTIAIMNPRTVTDQGQSRQGLVTDIQVSWKNKESQDFWVDFPEHLRKAKILCHKLFFELLTEETLEAHKPVFED